MGQPTKLEAAIATARAEWNADLVLAELHDAAAALRRRREDDRGFRVARDTQS